MDPSHKNLLTTLKISQLKRSKSRQLSASQKNLRDPKWMRLFHPSPSTNFKSKASRFRPYSIRPKSPVIEINPMFKVNTINLYKVLSKEITVDQTISKGSTTLRFIPEFSSFLDKNASLSRLNSARDDKRQCFTSRPSTASSRNMVQNFKTLNGEGAKTEKPSLIRSRPTTALQRNVVRKEMDSIDEFLPGKGNEFVSEVVKIWEKLDTGHRSDYKFKPL